MASYANQSFPKHPQRRVEGAESRAALRRGNRRSGALSGHGQFELGSRMVVSPPDASAAHRGVDAGHHHQEMTFRETIEPHDVIVDAGGMVQFSNFGEQFGRLRSQDRGYQDGASGPLIRPGFPTWYARPGNRSRRQLRASMMYQGGIARFDRKTTTFKTWTGSLRLHQRRDAAIDGRPQHWEADGKVWLNDAGGATRVYRMDMTSGAFENGILQRSASRAALGLRHLFGLKKLISSSSTSEARTSQDRRHHGKLRRFRRPLRDRDRRRRGRMDAQDRLWFGESCGKIGMFDTRTQMFREWPASTVHGSLRRRSGQGRRGVGRRDGGRPDHG